MSRKQKIFYGISSDFVGSLLASVVSIVVVPYYFRYVSIDEYGIWLAIQGVIGMITIADFGGDTYLTTIVADNAVFNDVDELSSQISTMVFMKILLSLIFAVIGLIVFYLLNIIITSNMNIYAIQSVFIISFIILILHTNLSTISTILNARHHYTLVNLFSSYVILSSSLFSAILLAVGFGIMSFALAMLASTVSQYLILFYILIKKYPFLGVKFSSITKPSIVRLYQFSNKFFLLKLSVLIRSNYIVLAISHLASTSYVTIYNITNKIPSIIPLFVSKIALALFPSLAELSAEGNVSVIKDIYFKLSKATWRLSLFSFVVVLAFNKSFVALWVGMDKYAGFWAMLLLAIYMAKYMVYSSMGVIVFATGKYGNLPFWAAVETILSITLSYSFYFIWDFVGIILGFLLPAFVTAIYLFKLVHNILEIDTATFFGSIWRYTLIPNLSTVCFAILINNAGVNSWVMLLCALMFLGITHVAFYDGIKFIVSKEQNINKRLLQAFEL